MTSGRVERLIKRLIKKALGYAILRLFLDTPKGIRIPVASVKGRCPRPLDDGGLFLNFYKFNGFL